MVDRKLAALAHDAYGNVTREEALAVGVTDGQIRSRLRKGSLHLEYPGVYRVGHRAPSLEASYMAAVKACGKGALLCGRAAACLLAVVTGAAPPPEVLTTTKRRIAGIIVHRSRTDLAVDAFKWRGVPVTSPARTIVDIAPALSLNDLARAFHEAGIRYGTTPDAVERVLRRRPTSPGARKLRRVIHGDVHVSLSALEKRFLRLLRDAGLPLPISNKIAAGGYVDCRWPDHKLIVELDGYRYHSSRHAWERDRRRERVARAAGYEFRRYTYGDVFEHPRLMMRELRQLLRSDDPTLLLHGNS
jgi:very-short-patch-repair endonuclease